MSNPCLSYRIVFPRGDRTQLSVVEVVDYEASEWAMASRQAFEYSPSGLAEAMAYASYLANRHGLVYNGIHERQNYLD